jgi:putative tryptophan/tyrosine transport system substrate-binding protein
MGAVVETFVDEAGVAPAVGRLAGAGVEAVVLTNSPLTVRNLGAIEAALAPTGLPVLATTNAASAAVVVLDPDTAALYEQLGRQAVRLLDGASPASVPVEDPARFRITVNRRVAAGLGLEVPESLLRQADTVVD